MIFRPELAEAILDGRKTVTRRLASRKPRSHWWIGGCFYKVGRDYAICPGRGKPAEGRIEIVNVELIHLGQGLTTAEARREGFADRGEFKWAWREINGYWSDGELVWRVEFRLIDPDDHLNPSQSG